MSRSPGGSRLNRQHMPDLSELDESWEVIPDSLEQIDTLPGRSKPDLATLPDSFDDPRGSAPSKATIRPAPQRRPDSESSYGVPADQFSPDLIHPGPPAGQPKKLHSQEKTSPPDAGARSQNQNPKMRIAPRRRPEGEPVEGQPEAMEQSRWQAAANRLKDLGIHKYRLSWNFERQKFLFCCILPSSDGSEVSDLFDADADTPLDAVETVVGQINEWLQQGRPSTSVPPN
ncbi:MAG: hypothetical protein EXS05_09080 [Planctomycetaceae bacterium]|nr:hypothetical protein [Planctomycetaceae bacterium]